MNVSDLISDGLPIKTIFEIIEDVNKNQINPKTGYYIDQYEGFHNILKPSVEDYKENGDDKKNNKIAINYQKLITNFSAAFLVGNPVTLNLLNPTSENSEKFKNFKSQWKKAKTDTAIFKSVNKLLVETRVAIQTLRSGDSLRHVLISSENSSKFFINFDDEGKADAFTRSFKRTDYNQTTKKVEQNSLIDFFTRAERSTYNIDKENPVLVGKPQNSFGKMPVVYASIDKPDFAAVQELIDRLERIISGNANANDYFMLPKLMITGSMEGLDLKKNTSGDIIHMKNGRDNPASAKYLVWEKQSESFKAEVEFLLDNIFNISSTPRLDFNNLKGLGTVSAVALQMMFLATTIKLKGHIMNWLDEFVERLISVFKNQLSNISGAENYNDLEIGFSFNDGLPTNEKEFIEMLNVASQGKTMSQLTAVENNKFVQNPVEEMEQIAKEEVQTLEGESFV